MKYISVHEAAEQWGISLRRVQYFCANDKIPGAKHMGRQWLIPSDAIRPADGRTRYGKVHPAESVYHFPVFIYTPLYGDPSGLSENEQQLLIAQKLRLEGKYLESIAICRDVLSESLPPYLEAGLYCTIGFDSLLLGIVSEYSHAIAEIERIISLETLHREDIKLMLASLYLNGSWDNTRLYAVEPSELSSEAVIYYKYCLLSAAYISGSLEEKAVIRYIRSECVQFEKDGIIPALFSFHCLLGVIGNTENSVQQRESHIRTAVRIAVENNWVANLSRYYNGASVLIENCLEDYGHCYVTNLRKVQQTTLRYWTVIHSLETGVDSFTLYSSEQIELLLLVSYQYSNAKIASVKCMTEAEVNNAVSDLCTLSGVSTKAELTAYAKKFFNAM